MCCPVSLYKLCRVQSFALIRGLLLLSECFRMVDEGQAILLVLLLYPLSSNCMLEELKAGLGGAKAYLDSLLPIINDGIKAVQVSNHWMPQEADFDKKHAEVWGVCWQHHRGGLLLPMSQGTADKGLPFKETWVQLNCALTRPDLDMWRRVMAVARLISSSTILKIHWFMLRKSSGGQVFSCSVLKPFRINFKTIIVFNSSCCAVHDECYDTCGEDKDLCDLTFRKCLYKVCRWLIVLLLEVGCTVLVPQLLGKRSTPDS